MIVLIPMATTVLGVSCGASIHQLGKRVFPNCPGTINYVFAPLIYTYSGYLGYDIGETIVDIIHQFKDIQYPEFCSH